MANQFTKGTRTKHDESTKDKIRAELLAQRLFKFAKSKGDKAVKNDMSQAQVAAARVLIERGKPALQAVEQTNVNPMDEMSQEQLLEQARALITSHPELIAQLNLMPKPVQVEQQSTESLHQAVDQTPLSA